MSLLKLIPDGFSKDIGLGHIIDVIVVVSIIVLPVLLGVSANRSYKRVSEDRSVIFWSRGEWDSSTNRKSISEEYLFAILLSSRTMLSFWGLGEKMFQELLLY